MAGLNSSYRQYIQHGTISDLHEIYAFIGFARLAQFVAFCCERVRVTADKRRYRAA
jgi:hypothetical protein